MRRSKRVGTLTIGGAALLLLTACDDAEYSSLPPRMQVYPNADACIAAGRPEMMCRSAHQTALREHVDGAPRFRDRKSCAAYYDQCFVDPVGGKGIGYIPAMAGFVPGSDVGLSSAAPVVYDRWGAARIIRGDLRLGQRCNRREDGSQDCSGTSSHVGSGGRIWSGSTGGADVIDTSGNNVRKIARGGFGRFLSGSG